MAFKQVVAVNVSASLTAVMIFAQNYCPEIEVYGILDVGLFDVSSVASRGRGADTRPELNSCYTESCSCGSA